MKKAVLATSLLCALQTALAGATPNPALPLLFIPNQGQVDPSIRYLIQSPELRAGFRADSVLLQLHGTQLTLHFRHADPQATVQGTSLLAARANFFTGSDPSAWKTDLPTYQGVEYRNLYPGIVASYGSAAHFLKSEFAVSPGADPRQIEMEYPESSSLQISPQGELVVRLDGTELREAAPEIYQTTSTGQRQAIPGRYRLIDAHTAGFAIDRYDLSRALIIDPTVTYSSYLGGSGMGAVTAVAVDTAGNLYAGGWTEAVDFPIQGALQGTNRGGVDAFVVKLNPAGSALLYATYIGGAGDDRIAALAVDGSGQVVAAGATGSSAFPMANAARATFVGGKEAFAFKLNAAGNSLVYSTFLGGSNTDAATAIAVDGSSNAYIAGDTQSADFVALYPLQSVYGGGTDAFIVQLGPLGAIVYSSLLGGNGAEHVGGIALDASRNVYLAGGTFSTNFPTVLALQANTGGGQDAFLAKLNSPAPATAPSLLYSTYLGGSSGSATAPEQANAIAVDSTGNIYLTGVTSSTNFPISAGAIQTSFSGSRDAFVTKLNSARQIVYSTFLGATGFDWATGIAADSAGNAYVTGYTSSVSFPNIGGVQTAFNGQYDAFVTKYNAAGGGLTYSALYGGTGADQSNAIAVDTGGNVYFGGQTGSIDFPVASPVQSANNGGSVGWVARMGAPVVPTQVPSAGTLLTRVAGNGDLTLTARFSDTGGPTALTNVALLISRSTALDFACYITYDRAANQLSLAPDVAANASLPVPTSGVAQNDQCTVRGAGSSAVISGTDLILTVVVALGANFPGNNNIYLYAADATSNTGFVVRPLYPQVSADSVSPTSGTGAAQVFTFVFSDTQAASNVTGMAVLINSSLTTTGACYFVFDHTSSNTIALLYDSAAGSTPKPLGSNATVQNSQCAIGAATLTVSGNSNTLTVPIAFSGPFTGPKNVYILAVGPLNNTGWVQRGTFNVMAGGVPVANSVSPGSGTGSGGLFSFTVSDRGGSNFITGAAVLFAPTLNAANACYIIFDRAANKVSLAFDNISGSSPVTLGSTSSVSNTRCTLSAVNSTVTTTTTTLTLTLNITFLPAFAGAKSSYLFASETAYTSGWQTVGTWTVPGTPPTVISLSPSTGTARSAVFTFSASDAASATNLQQIQLLVTGNTFSNACYVSFDNVAKTIGLYGDDGVTLSTKPLGSSANLQNSQCAIGSSSANTVGNSVAVTANLVFKNPPFSGTKTIYVRAVGTGGDSTYIAKGVWTIP